MMNRNTISLSAMCGEIKTPYRSQSVARCKPGPRRAGPKIGRNSPCPCGSGKKFKECCHR